MKNRNELFIVIATAAFLAFFMFTVLNMGTGCGKSSPLGMAKEKAKQTTCINNLKQIGLASSQYAISFNDCRPASSQVCEKNLSDWRMDSDEWNRLSRSVVPVWMKAESGRSLDILRTQDLLIDPKGYICPSKEGIAAAQVRESLRGHVSYNWCDGIIEGNCTMSPVACDGTDNHFDNSGRFLRGDCSVGSTKGGGGKSWTQNSDFVNYCYNKRYTDFSF